MVLLFGDRSEGRWEEYCVFSLLHVDFFLEGKFGADIRYIEQRKLISISFSIMS